jgi:diacylglycerol O-acyltransferase / wax synthase
VLGIYEPQRASGRPLNAALLRELVSQRLHLLPLFRWWLANVPLDLDYPYWVDDGTFDVEYHVRELALPAPGDCRQLADQVASIISRPLDPSHPPWELYVIHGLEDGGVALLTNVHHAAVDGMSGTELLSVLLDLSPEGREIEPAADRRLERYPSEARCWPVG